MIIIVCLILLFFENFRFTGNISLEINEKIKQGETLDGTLRIILQQGEFMPYDSRVILHLNEQVKDLSLSELIKDKPEEGIYYVRNSNVSGYGFGYGLLGIKDAPPEIEFQIRISQKSSEIEDLSPPLEEEKEKNDSGGESSLEENFAESKPESIDIHSSSEEESSERALITGAVISENSEEEFIVSGKVRKGEDFTYTIEGEQNAEIIKGSVKINEREVSEDKIKLKKEGNTIIVSTDLSFEEGYGPEYGGEKTKELEIDLSKFEIIAEEGTISIEIIFQGERIAHYSRELEIEKKNINQSEMPSAFSNLTNFTETEFVEINITNMSLRQIKEIEDIVIDDSYELDMSDYFVGAENYELFAEDIRYYVEGHIITLVVEDNFNGSRNAKIVASSSQDSIESNEFLITKQNIEVFTKRSKVVLGRPVKWIKNLSLGTPGNITLELPKIAENISVRRIDSKEEKEIPLKVKKREISGMAVFSHDEKKRFLDSISDFFGILTGRAITETNNSEKTISEASNGSFEILLQDSALSYIVEYETPGPEAIEYLTDRGKIMIISAPDELGYSDIIAYTYINRSIFRYGNKIKIYWRNYDAEGNFDIKNVSEVPDESIVEDTGGARPNNRGKGNNEGIKNNETDSLSSLITANVVFGEDIHKIDLGNDAQKEETRPYKIVEIPFEAYDTDNDTLIDYIEWVVPHLSNQTYEIVIEIVGAYHLDSNRSILKDIYPEVSRLDGNWSEEILENEYVRIIFERNLTAENDITIYPRKVKGKPRIEVYELNKTDIIAEFNEILDDEYNKVILRGLNESQNTFDLLVKDGALIFDYIYDPALLPPGKREGMVAYAITGNFTVKYRHWNGTAFGSELTANNVGENIEWLKICSNPVINEYFIGTADAGDDINIQFYGPKNGGLCWHNGTACTTKPIELTATSINTDTRKFDIAYESISGDAMIVYSNGLVAPQVSIYKYGSAPTAPVNVNHSSVAGTNIGPLNISGNVEWVDLSARPRTDEIALAYATSTDDLNVLIWNGTVFNCESPLVLDLTLNTGDYQKISGVYESVSGDFFLVWTNTSINGVRYVTKSANTCTFSSVQRIAVPGVMTGVEAYPNPNTDEIMIVAFNASATAAAYWNGTAINSSVFLDPSGYSTIAVPNKPAAAGWAGRYGVVTYSDAANNFVLDYVLFNTSSKDWVIPSDFTPTPLFSDEDNILMSYSFLDEDLMMALIKDDTTADLWAKVFNGNTLQWVNVDNGAPLQENTLADFPAHGFAFRRGNYSYTQFFPPTIENGSVILSSQTAKANVSSLLDGLQNISIRFYNSSALVNETYFFSSPAYIEFYPNTTRDGLIYYFNASSYSTKLISDTETRTFSVDAPPIIKFVYPPNGTFFNYDVGINYTVSDTNLQSCWWTNNSGLSNNSITCGNNITSLWANGLRTIWIYANDSSGNVGSAYASFIFDTIAPSINFTTPTPENGSVINASSISINITINDTNQHYSFVDLDGSLILWMRMDDLNSSGGIIDRSGYSNNGTSFGNSIQNDSGKFGKSFSFDGNGDYIYVNLSMIPNFTQATVAAWIKSNSNEGGILSPSNSGYPGLHLWQYVGRPYADVTAGSIVNSTCTSSKLGDPLNTGQWYFVALVFNGINASLYQDGEYQGSGQNIPSSCGNVVSGDYFIGALTSSNTFFNGSIDDVIVFNRTLSDEEIKSLYNAGIYKYGTNVSISEGIHTFRGYAVDEAGNINNTEERVINYSSIVYINSCRILDIPNSINMLTEDIIINISGACIDIEADNVVLDCKGYRIYNASYDTNVIGVYSNMTNTTIRNCKIITSPIYANTVIGENPTAYYRLGEEEGTTAVDSSPSGEYSGSYIGTPVWVNGAIINDQDKAVKFSGSEYIDISNLGGFIGEQMAYGGSDFYEFWLKFSSDSEMNLIEGMVSGSNSILDISLNTDSTPGRIRVKVIDENLFTINGYADTSINDGLWHHLAIEVNPYNSYISIYVDGVEQSISYDSQEGGYYFVSFDTLTISSSSHPYIGEIDEIAIYSQTGSITNIINHYTIGKYGNVTTGGAFDGGIAIKLIDAVNFSIINTSTGPAYIGLNLINSSYGNIEILTANTNFNGLSVQLGSNYNNFSRIISERNYNVGIIVQSCLNNTFNDMNLSYQTYGLMLFDSNYSKINSVTTNYNSINGIYLQDSNNNILSNITSLSNQQYGLMIKNSKVNYVYNGTLADNYIYDLWLDTSKTEHCNNLVMGLIGSGNRPIRIVNSSESITNLNFSELLLCNAAGANIESVIVDGSQSIYNNGVVVIRTNGASLSNVNSSGNYYGFYLYNSSYINLTNSVAFVNRGGSGGGGLYLSLSNNNNITLFRSLSNLYQGIQLLSSNNNSFSSVTSSYNLFNSGVYTFNSNNNIFNNITSNSNNLHGIFLSSSTNNKIYNLTAVSNIYDGITLSSSGSNYFGGGNINGSGRYGIALGSSENNAFYNLDINNTKNNAIYISAVQSYGNNFTFLRISGTSKSYYDLVLATQSINGTIFTDTEIGNYSLLGVGGTFIYRNSTAGEIRFISPINGSGIKLVGESDSDIIIGNNSVFVNSTRSPGLNRSANVTLHGIRTDFTNPKVLKDGYNCNDCYNFTSLNAGTVVFNVSSWSNYSIGESNELNSAPENPIITLNSTTGSNRTLQNLNCFAVLTDSNNNNMNVTVKWFNNSVLHLTIDYNNSYSNGTLFTSLLGYGNTTKGENWSCSMRVSDGQEYSAWTHSAINITILNTPPIVTLSFPPDSNITTNRTEKFSWAIADDDGDTVTSEFNMTAFAVVTPIKTCSENIYLSGMAGTSFNPTSPLLCFRDNGYQYNWSVRVTDGEAFSSWTQDWRINITALTDLTMIVDEVNFNNINYLSYNDTTDNSPQPFIIQNNGNAYVDVNLSATSLWQTIANPNKYYQFKFDNASGKEGAFNWSGSIVKWENLSLNSILGISYFNYSDDRDLAEMDIYIEVPPNEPPSQKISTITFTPRLAE